jgi:hypothetical protein
MCLLLTLPAISDRSVIVLEGWMLDEHTEQLEVHTTHIKIYIDGRSWVQFDWINKHTILLSPCRSYHIVTCSCQPISCLSTKCKDSVSQVQRVFIVELYLATHSYLTCQNEFRDTFSNSSVPRKSTVSHVSEPFPWNRKHAGQTVPVELWC